jgi:hypothetical protein
MSASAYSSDEARLIALLDEQHEWPSLFAFKFIVPEASAAALRAAIPAAERVEERASSGGKYTSFTFHCPVGSGREVLDLYARVHGSKIPGLISL